MLNKKDFTTFAKRVLHHHKGLRNPQIMHPAREWFVGLIIATVIFLLSIAWSAYTYVSHQSVSTEAVSLSADQPVVYRESMVKTALQIFADKEQLEVTPVVATTTLETVPTTTIQELSEGALENEENEETEPTAPLIESVDIESTEIPPEDKPLLSN